MRVSIITVVYNGATSIERTIKSVLEQTYNDIEYIVIDGQSNDGTQAVIEKYHAKLAKIVSEPDEGIYDAMNKGIALATGELIGIINSDDWYELDAVSIMVNAYAQHPKCGIFHGLLRHVSISGDTQKIIGHRETFLPQGMIEHPTCFVTKNTYQSFKYDINYKIVADYAFMLKAAREGISFCFVPQLIANFTIGGASASFNCADETLTLQYKYGFISILKRYLLTFYFWLNLRR